MEQDNWNTPLNNTKNKAFEFFNKIVREAKDKSATGSPSLDPDSFSKNSLPQAENDRGVPRVATSLPERNALEAIDKMIKTAEPHQVSAIHEFLFTTPEAFQKFLKLNGSNPGPGKEGELLKVQNSQRGQRINF